MTSILLKNFFNRCVNDKNQLIELRRRLYKTLLLECASLDILKVEIKYKMEKPLITQSRLLINHKVTI